MNNNNNNNNPSPTQPTAANSKQPKKAPGAPTSGKVAGDTGRREIDPKRFKTRLCRHYLTNKGACPFIPKCAFAHGEHELRTVDENLSLLGPKNTENADVCPSAQTYQAGHNVVNNSITLENHAVGGHPCVNGTSQVSGPGYAPAPYPYTEYHDPRYTAPPPVAPHDPYNPCYNNGYGSYVPPRAYPVQNNAYPYVTPAPFAPPTTNVYDYATSPYPPMPCPEAYGAAPYTVPPYHSQPYDQSATNTYQPSATRTYTFDPYATPMSYPTPQVPATNGQVAGTAATPQNTVYKPSHAAPYTVEHATDAAPSSTRGMSRSAKPNANTP